MQVSKKLTEIHVYHNVNVFCTQEHISTFLIKIELIVIDFNDFYYIANVLLFLSKLTSQLASYTLVDILIDIRLDLMSEI